MRRVVFIVILILASLAGAEPYTVRQGDSFSLIAKSWRCFGEEDLRIANPRVNPKDLQPGMLIEIPSVSPASYSFLTRERDVLKHEVVYWHKAYVRLRVTAHDLNLAAHQFDRQEQRAKREVVALQKRVTVGIVGWVFAVSFAIGIFFLVGVAMHAVRARKSSQKKVDTLLADKQALQKRFADQVRLGRMALEMPVEEFTDFQGLLARLFTATENRPEIIARLEIYLRRQNGSAQVRTPPAVGTVIA